MIIQGSNNKKCCKLAENPLVMESYLVGVEQTCSMPPVALAHGGAFRLNRLINLKQQTKLVLGRLYGQKYVIITLICAC